MCVEGGGGSDPVNKINDNDLRSEGLFHASIWLSRIGRPASVKGVLGKLDRSYKLPAAWYDAFVDDRKRGISVVIPTFCGAERIQGTLRSLADQELDRGLFEVIVVLNGPVDGTQNVVEVFHSQNPSLNIRLMRSARAGAGHARNYGMTRASFDHVTFLDDDDTITPSYLQSAFNRLDGSSVVLCGIEDVKGGKRVPSAAYEPLRKLFDGHEVLELDDLSSAGWALTMTVLKVFPTIIADAVKFSEVLPNGEDVVFWTEALRKFSPKFKFVPHEEKALYLRHVRDGSISRQGSTFKFSVVERCLVLKELEKIDPSGSDRFVRGKVDAALMFINNYLVENPADQLRVIEHIKRSGFRHEARYLSYLNAGLAKKLTVSFCFPPYVDTAGIVTAKRIFAAREPTDVISANMSAARETEPTLAKICNAFTGSHLELPIKKIAFADKETIEEFATGALRAFKSWDVRKSYEKLYSRALWPASHFAAALIKANDKQIHWTAEFSDPLLLDIFGKERSGIISQDWLKDVGLVDAVMAVGGENLRTSSLFKWAEYLPYILADELLFTNANQMEYMLAQDWVQPFREKIVDKASVKPHPTPSADQYKVVECEYGLGATRINIGYFGNFYKTRGLADVLLALSKLPKSARPNYALHVFSNEVELILEKSRELGIQDMVFSNAMRPYHEFLNLCTKFDYLLVNDAETAGVKPMNPYLPSKLSDYLGADAAIWALVEPGSILDQRDLPRHSKKSKLGNITSYVSALKNMRKYS